MYDYILGGKDNFAIDRESCDQIVSEFPDMFSVAPANRAFLVRAVRYIAKEVGIEQFVDIGSGLPTQNNVHQVAQGVNPNARVVYVDNDPIVLAHGRALLATNDLTTVITADATRPEEILNNPDLRNFISFDEPVVVLFIALLHCLPDEDDPGGSVARLLEAMPSGSYLVLSHIVSDDPEAAEAFTRKVNSLTRWGRVRTREEVAQFFTGLELVDPGLVDIREWRPDSPPPPLKDALWELSGVARKP